MPEEETSASVLRSLVEWSQDRPSWQRDALRRLCQTRTLTDDDHAELLRICKETHGLRDDENAAPTAVPVADTHIPADDAGRERVALRCVRDVKHVNALTSDQKVKFQKDGLTIIYGHNGSGKSGYARILAKACRSRATGDILPNVYEAAPTDAPTATIEYAVGDSNQTFEWVAGGDSADALSSVSFFDSACANVNVAEANSLAYTPTPLTILGDLARACRQLKDQLQTERTVLDAQTPEGLREPPYRPETQVGQLFARLSATTDFEEFERLATLSEQEQQRLETLRRDLADDPARRAGQLEATQRRLNTLITTAEQLDGLVSDDAVQRFRDLLQDAETKREAARLAAEALFEDAPLPHVGSATWRALWDAARAYSAEAYPDQPFPVVADDSRCVLCQQPLSEEARTRFITFEQFVQDNAQQAATTAEQAVQQHRQRLLGITLSRGTTRGHVELVERDIENAELAAQLRRYLILGRRRSRVLRAVTQASAVPAFGALPPDLVAALRQQSTDLTQRIAALQQTGQSAERRQLVAELHELEDRQWLGTVLQVVRAEISRRQHIRALDNCIRDTDTNAITRKSSSISDTLVTATLRQSFASELQKLGLSQAFVELSRQTSEAGTSRFQVSFIRTANARVERVLSEGEHRCIALAAFMAELTTAPSPSGIVFDDPVSSLDHRYREAFARRLAQEASHRQVIVYTHDLWFVFCLDREARKLKANLFYQHVCRNDQFVGLCDAELPIDSRPVLEAVGHFKRRLTQISALHTSGKIAEWQEQAEGLIGRVRKAWERAVEQAISPVLQRFDHSVDTKKLLMLTVLTEDDCRLVDEARAACSRLQHSEAVVVQSPIVSPDQVSSEIEKLEAWINNINTRQHAISK